MELDYPEISAVRMAEQLTLRAVSCASDDPWKSGGDDNITPGRTHNRIRSPRLAASGP